MMDVSTRLRPHPFLVRRGALAALAFFVPVFAALYFLTAPNGPWGLVMLAQVLITTSAAACFITFTRVYVEVDESGITERGFFGRISHVPAGSVGTVLLADIFHGGWTETAAQLFVTDTDGRQRIRLRGQFWPREAMTTVLTTLDAPTVEIDHPVSVAELHGAYPGLLYWFERHPVYAACAFAGLLLAAGGLLYLVLVALGRTL